jgi:hypothetical protein
MISFQLPGIKLVQQAAQSDIDPPANIQREGDLDLLLRCLEDEFNMNKDASAADFPSTIR